MKKIVVTGAAGGLGLALCEHLSSLRKYAIRGCVAPWDSKERVAELRQYVSEVIVGNITKEPDVQRALQGMNVLVNCAAALADKHDKNVQFQVNVRANELLLRSAKRYGLEKMIVISTAGVATSLGQGVDNETSPFRKHLHNYHIWSKIENEKMLARVSKEINYYCIILRPASIYGPHMTFRWGEIIEYVKKGTMRVFNDPISRYPLIHERDLVRAIELSIEKIGPLKANEVMIISSDEPTSLHSIVNFIATEMKVLLPRRLPYWAVLAASYIIVCIPMSLRSKQLQLISPWSVREYRQGHAYVTEKAKKLIGFTAEVRFEEAMREILKIYREKGISHWS